MTNKPQLTEHLSCRNNDRSDRPMIEVVQFTKGSGSKHQISNNEVVCIIEGKIKFAYRDYAENEVKKEEVFFLPAGGLFSFTALEECTAVVMRLDGHVQLCENYRVERLYQKPDETLPTQAMEMNILTINPPMRFFLTGLIKYFQDGIRCRYLFELKIKEFFHLLLTYYSKIEIHGFLLPILSSDTAFSEYVRKNWRKYHTVEELAESMYMSSKQFSKKFKDVFGNTAYHWMKKSKAQSIHREIMAGNKPLKLIAAEYDFGSISTFSKFCKKELGDSPLRLRKAENA